ncbi:flowering time control protein FPA-like isoform X1 [Primulina huaijiensis]|uniref:flowering time control protein FPA-like isoform X1 n=1 Tax=Primulina huaijiensis TaxID=1492673 RepID=UPI003CC77AD3
MAPVDKAVLNPSQIPVAWASGVHSNPPSNNLWIGNVSLAVTEAELKALLENHGKIDSLTLYPSRNYAFVYFREIESAVSAKLGLQGYVLHENPLKIEFAKSAKPCKSLWVAGISQSISKDELEKEFLRFGTLQEFRFLRDRNTAYVDYVTLDDAAKALRGMNGKRIGGDQLRVDYLRSLSSKREQGPDSQFPNRSMGPSDFHWMTQNPLKIYSEPSLVGSKRKNILSVGPQNGNSQLTHILNISYPPAAIIEEDMIHNAMILFGEIERIKTFADGNNAFVEFRSIEEARRAKEGLQGKLFNDPRISIEYFSGELGPENDYIPHYPGVEGQLREFPFRPVQMDIPGLNHPVIPVNNPGHQPLRPLLGPHGPFDPALPGPEFSDSAPIHKLQNLASQTLMGVANWRSSPASGIVSSPPAGLIFPNRSAFAAWEDFDDSQHRESKRPRFDAALPFARVEKQGSFHEQYGLISRSGGASGSLTRVGGLGQRLAESDCIWRGIIAKGGTLVCHARCVCIGDGLDADIPDVVNCSARTGLDLLSKHYDEAIGFNIVFFLPDSEEDFAPYTEFLRYLGSKDRAGVAKFDDGTTLFLVPPSDLLTKVLKVSGPERLYGVVLKFPQQAPSSASVHPQSIQPHYVNMHKTSSLLPGYCAMPQMDRDLNVDYSRVLPEDSKVPPKPPGSMTSNSFSAPSVPPSTIVSQAGLALTPELIAALTSLRPATSSSGSQIVSLPQSTSMLGPASEVATGPNMDAMQWKQELHALDHHVQPVQHLGTQINSQLQHAPQAHTQSVSDMTSHFHQPISSYSQMHEHNISFPSQGEVLSKSMTPAIQLQSGTVAASQVNPQYQQGSPQNIHGIDYRTEAVGFYSSSVVQQQAYPMAFANQAHGIDVTQTQPYIPETSGIDPTHKDQHLHTAPYGAVPESTETEADKNERYKTTLLFAANLLSRIHQPSGYQPGQGAGSN